MSEIGVNGVSLWTSSSGYNLNAWIIVGLAQSNYK